MSKNPDWSSHIILTLGVILFALPVWLVIAGSTQSSDAIARGDLSLIPHQSGLAIYWKVLTQCSMGTQPVWHMLLISLGMALSIALGKITISLLSAYAIVFFRFPFRRAAFWLIFITLMLPVEVRIIPTYAVMADFHLINTFTGLALPLIASATATLLFPPDLRRDPRRAGRGHAAWTAPDRYVSCATSLIPVSASNIAALFVILFVYGWNQFLLAATGRHRPTPRHHRHWHRHA